MATAKTKTVKKQINQIPDIFIGGTLKKLKHI
ncbi:baseplate wedge subunit [Klebsiella phage CPRSA]|nr:baseplate wedge subunit [Klebsiella phage CPRSA]